MVSNLVKQGFRNLLIQVYTYFVSNQQFSVGTPGEAIGTTCEHISCDESRIWLKLGGDYSTTAF